MDLKEANEGINRCLDGEEKKVRERGKSIKRSNGGGGALVTTHPALADLL
jgi:hypothetical protein